MSIKIRIGHAYYDSEYCDNRHLTADSMLAAAYIKQLFCGFGTRIVADFSTTYRGRRWVPQIMIVCRIIGYLAYKKSWSHDLFSHYVEMARAELSAVIDYPKYYDCPPPTVLRLQSEPDIKLRYFSAKEMQIAKPAFLALLWSTREELST
jgi:hypothetical protein